MQIRFEKMVEVEFLHRYFGTGGSDELLVEPTSGCRRQMANGSILFKRTARGFVLLCEATGDAASPQPLRKLSEGVKYSWLVTPLNSFHLNYSDLPLEGGSSYIYYLSNLQDNRQGGKLLLSADKAGPYLSELDRLPLKPMSFQWTGPSLASGSEVDVLDASGNVVQTDIAVINAGAAACRVNLQGFLSGRYAVRPKGGAATPFYASDEAAAGKALAVLDIFYGSKVPQPYRFLNDDLSFAGKTYTLQTDQRKTFWKYYVVLKYRTGVSPDDLSITCPSLPVVFNRLAAQTLSDGNTAVPFVSAEAIALGSKPVKGISLKKNNESSFEISNLANPPVMNLTPDSSDGKVYSEVYIYI